MRVQCPSCASVYEVPEPLLGARRRSLRCGHCGAEWALAGAPPEPPGEPPAEPPATEPEEPPERQPAAPQLLPEPAIEPFGAADAPAAEPEVASQLVIPQRERERPFALGPSVSAEERPAPEQRRSREARDGAAWLGWLLSLALLALLVWAGYTYRGAVMHAWPPSERLYALLGLGPARP